MKWILAIVRIVAAVLLLGIAKTFLVEGGYPYRHGGFSRDWRLIFTGFAIGLAAWLLIRTGRSSFRTRP